VKFEEGKKEEGCPVKGIPDLDQKTEEREKEGGKVRSKS